MNNYLIYKEKEEVFKKVQKRFKKAFVFSDGLCLCRKNSILKEVDKIIEMDFIIGVDTRVIDTYFIAHCVENNKWCYCFFSKIPYPMMYYVSCLEFIEENIIDHGMYDNIEELLKSSFCQEVINCREGIYLSEKQKEDNFNKVNNDMYPKGGCRICSSEITAVPNPYNNGWNYIDLLLGFVDGDYYSDLMIAHDIKTNKWLTIATDNRKTTEDCFTCLSWSDTIDDAISDL